jgi:hypothetical protein
MITTAVHVQFVEILDDRVERMSRSSFTNFPHDTSDHFLLFELRRVKIAAIPLKHWPDFLDDVHSRALARRIKPGLAPAEFFL